MRFAAPVLAWVLAAATAVSAGPAASDPRVIRPLNELIVRDPMEVARFQHLEKRMSTDFHLDHKWNNEVLFGGYDLGGRIVPHLLLETTNMVYRSWIDGGDSDSESVALKIVCIECWTRGTVTAKLTTEDIVKPVVRLEFSGVEAYVNLGVSTSAGATYAINLFSTDNPTGLGLPGLSVGLVFHLDLVFSLSAAIDLTGGFYVKVADDAFLETSVFDGKIVDHFLLVPANLNAMVLRERQSR